MREDPGEPRRRAPAPRLAERARAAMRLLEACSGIRTVQELIGHKHVATTVIYTHVLNRSPAGVQSPADRLLGG